MQLARRSLDGLRRSLAGLELAVRILVTFLLLALIPATAAAEDGHAAWLRYAPLESAARTRAASLVPDRIVTRGDSPQILRAR